MLALNPGHSTGVTVNPNDQVLATSGVSFEFPSITWPHWPDTHCVMLLACTPSPYSAAVTPVRSHWVSDNVGIPAHGSLPNTFSCPNEGARNSSIKFGARTARSKENRRRASWIGAYCTSNL